MSKGSGKQQLEVILNYRDRLSGRSGRTVASLRQLEGQGRKTLSVIEKINKALGQGGARARAGRAKLPPMELPAGGRTPRQIAGDTVHGLRVEREQVRLLREQSRLRQDNARLALVQSRGSRSSSAGELADIRLLREKLRLQREADRLTQSRRRRPGRFGESVETARRTIGTARDFHQAGQTSYDMVRGFTDPAIKNVRSEERFRIMGFTPEQNRMAFSKVDEVVGSTRGVRRADVIETLSGLINTFGDVEEAVQFLPITSKYRANMEALYGDRYGPEQVTRQVGDAFKALELLGIDTPTGRDAAGKAVFTDGDRRRMEQYFNIIAQATAATGGEINPSEFREFVQYMRIAGTNISPEGLQKMIPMVQQMGGSQAGTGLMTLYSNLVGGRIPAHKLRYWDELGLLDKKKVEFNKTTGQVQRLLPGAIPVAQDLGRDPVAVADRIGEALAKKGIDTKDKDAVNKQLMAMLGDRTGLGELAQMINFRASIDKEVEKNARAFDIERTYESSVVKSPLGNYLDLSAQWENTRALAGRSTAEAGGTLSGYLSEALRKVGATAGQNPAYDMAAIGVLTLGKASADAADGVGGLEGIVRRLTGGGAGGGGSVAGALPGVGVDTSDALMGGWGLWKGLRWLGRAGLTGAGAAISSPITVGLLGAGIGGYGLYERGRARHAGENADAATARTFGSLQKLREASGGRLPQDVARSQAEVVFGGLNRADDLTAALQPGFGNMHKRLYSPGPYQGWLRQYEPERAAPAFRQRAPELAFAEVMSGFLQDINRRAQAGQITWDSRDKIAQTAQTAFPESYKQAAEQIAQLTGQVTPLAGAFTNLIQPAQTLAPGLSNAQTAAQNFAHRVNALDLTIPVPVFQPFAVGGGGTPAPAPSLVPGSAVGSVVRRDGLVSVHKGNVITPASLSRRSPGDWLDDFRPRRVAGGESPAPAPSHTTVRVEEFGARRAPVSTPADDAQSAGPPDFSLFRRAASPGHGRGDVNIESITVTVPPGSEAAADPAALARLIAAEVQRQVADAAGQLHDPDYIATMVAYQVGRESERL